MSSNFLTSPAHSQLLRCQVNGVVVACPPVACPGDQVTFTGTALREYGNNLWMLPIGTCPSSDTPDALVLAQSIGYCRGESFTCGLFKAINTDPGPSTPCLTSNLTITMTSDMVFSIIEFGAQNVTAHTTRYNVSSIIAIGKYCMVTNVPIAYTATHL